MTGSNRLSTHSSGGFTLVEIAVAVAILGVALVTLVGLHTRMLDTYFIERNRLQASLYAQYLMTMIEVEPDAPEPGSDQKSLLSKLRDAGYFDEDSFEQADESLKDWNYVMQVESIGLPLAVGDLAEDALRRVDLSIQWGPSDDEQYTLTHFINPTPESNTGAVAPTAPGQPPAAASTPQNPFNPNR